MKYLSRFKIFENSDLTSRIKAILDTKTIDKIERLLLPYTDTGYCAFFNIFISGVDDLKGQSYSSGIESLQRFMIYDDGQIKGEHDHIKSRNFDIDIHRDLESWYEKNGLIYFIEIVDLNNAVSNQVRPYDEFNKMLDSLGKILNIEIIAKQATSLYFKVLK